MEQERVKNAGSIQNYENRFNDAVLEASASIAAAACFPLQEANLYFVTPENIPVAGQLNALAQHNTEHPKITLWLSVADPRKLDEALVGAHKIEASRYYSERNEAQA
ncbi:42328_t:CDS:2 [Gigaspora margarita]|uniref:42328_t:CDS:1 n=1 Tax=Gigaspora margarita TaxID=4874 RepID=A0ABN7VIP8_GIGMA|nr:42328_t:CDS:2 [Gigaspora margarita]